MAIMNESVLEIVLQLCSLVVRILVSATFISAGYFKIRSADSWFSNVFHTFDLRETTVTKSFFILLPWFEIGIGVMLLVGFILKFVAVIGATLIFLFTFFTLRAATFSKYLDCGCFGKTKAVQRSVVTISIRNIVLLGLILLLYVSPFHIWQSKPIFAINPTINNYIIVIMLMLIFVFVVCLVFITGRYTYFLSKVAKNKENVHAK